MSKKQYFLIVDTETTIKDRVVDFGAIICDRKGTIVKECGILVKDIFGIEPLFYIPNERQKSIWSKQGKDKRFTNYNLMLNNGDRMLASVPAINRWLALALANFNPILTAYNLSFDLDKCFKTGIDLSLFENKFCLWHASVNKWAHTKQYKNFVLQSHAFNSPTDLNNMSYKTNAEIMTGFILNNLDLPKEPHTALEDIKYYELPILKRLVKGKSRKQLLAPIPNFNWRKVQVRDHYIPT